MSVVISFRLVTFLRFVGVLMFYSIAELIISNKEQGPSDEFILLYMHS